MESGVLIGKQEIASHVLPNSGRSMRLTKTNLSRYALPEGKSEALLFDDDMPGFGLRVRAGGKRTWIAQYRLGAKQRRITLGTTETLDPDEARKRAREALAKVSLGGDPQNEKRAAREQAAVTFGSIVPRYLAYAVPRQKPNHHRDTKRYLERHWAPLTEMALNTITRATISHRLGIIAKDNGPFAANRARAALSAFYGWAIGDGVATLNPVIGTHKPTDEKARNRVLSDVELAAVWKAAGSGDFGRIVRLLILTGQRCAEVGGMAWSEVEYDVWTIKEQRAKNGEEHAVPLSPSALAVLGPRVQEGGRDLVFGKSDGPFQGWSNAKASLDRRLVKSRRPGAAAPFSSPWRLHDIRRTVATGMANLGVLPHIVETVLNHISGHKAGVSGTYNRSVYASAVRDALTLWAAHVEKLVGKPT